MLSTKIKSTIGVLAFFLTVSCAKDPRTKVNVPIDAVDAPAVERAAVKQTKSKFFTEIEFKKGSAALKEEARQSINNIIEAANMKGEIDELIVLSWADVEYPSNAIKKLSPEQRKLAKKRNQAISSYAKTVGYIEVDTYSMAEKPNALSKLFNTSDKRIKESMLEAGLKTTADRHQAASKASHALIMVKLK